MPLFAKRDALSHIDDVLSQMLLDSATSLNLARQALFEGADPKQIGPTLRATDRQINEGEREVRRAVLVHIAVAGPADAPALLAYMSVVKDAERLGDYAKNIFELADLGADLGGASDGARLTAAYDSAAGMVPEAAECFVERDAERSRELLAQADELLTLCDREVSHWATSADPAGVAVVRALLFRYLKRVVAHISNLLSAVVMPLDQLDHFDEDNPDLSVLDEDPTA